MKPAFDQERTVEVTPSTNPRSRNELREGVTPEPAPRNVLRAVLRPVKIHFEEQNHELQKVGKIELTELPWNKTQ